MTKLACDLIASLVLFLHQMCINEAAALLCRHQPSLLTRREDLFSLARQVVRESGFQCSKVHSRLVVSHLRFPVLLFSTFNLILDHVSDQIAYRGAQIKPIQ